MYVIPCLVFISSYSFTTADQEGRRSIPRHVYANPQNPAACPVLALAIWIFTRPDILPSEDSAPMIFQRKNQESRFSDWLNRIVLLFKVEVETLGLQVDEIG